MLIILAEVKALSKSASINLVKSSRSIIFGLALECVRCMCMYVHV